MRPTRAEWARKCGERKAKQCGFLCFPIDPFWIAENENILVQAKKADQIGVSGGIIFNDEDVGIFYATNISNPGFQRFTVGHELGHYFLEGHPEEILKTGPLHASKAGFSQGDQAIEIEADHFSSGLLLPGHLVLEALGDGQIGLEGVEKLSELSKCSLTASAIRAAECSPYPMAIVMSRADRVCYGFLSDGFKQLKPRAFPRKGELLPNSTTRQFNLDTANVENGKRLAGETTLADWFDGPPGIILDEEVLGLGKYGYTLTVFSSEELPEEPDEFEDEEANLIDSYTAKFAYGR